MNLQLKIAIIKSKKPQTYLAHAVGIPESYLSKIVNGWVIPKIHLKTRIADELGVEISTIFAEGSIEANYERD